MALLAIGLGVSVCLPLNGVNAATLMVPETYASIQGAVNAASAGDVISVGDGVYHETPTHEEMGIPTHVLVNKEITIRARVPFQAILDGNDDGAAFFLVRSTARIEGFVIRNVGLGVVMRGGAPGSIATVSNLIIDHAEFAIGVDDCCVRVGAVSASNLVVANSETAFYTNDGTALRVRNTIVSHCDIGFAGHNHDTFEADYILLDDVAVPRVGTLSSVYLPALGPNTTMADPLFATVTYGSRSFPYYLHCESPAIDVGSPGLDYEDIQLPPSQGAARNDLGAYGGPGAFLGTLSGEEQGAFRLAADDIAPTLVVPVDISVETGPGKESCEVAGVVVQDLGSASSDDNCGSAQVAVTGVPEGNVFPVGVATISYTATDAAGNATTHTQMVTVRCPVAAIAGMATQTCNGNTVPAGGVTVRLLHEGVGFLEVVTGTGGDYMFPNVRLGTYTVQIVAPEGYAVPIDTRVVTLAEEGATVGVDGFPFTCLLGDITGRVDGTCDGSTASLQGVTVDLFREGSGGMDVLVGSVATDATGTYRFDDVALGEYTVTVVAPLGYSAVGSSTGLILTEPDVQVAAAPTVVACQAISAVPRGMGYWKHQVNVYLTGKGHADESLSGMLGYLDLLTQHFNDNVVNPVIVYVPGGANTTDKLLQLQQLLTVNKGGTALDRAKRELLAMLLNVVSGKISQTHGISVDGATVSQAITYCDHLIDTSNGDYGRAQAIAEYVNGGTPVPAGMIPLTTAQIAYRQELALRSFRVTPNPGLGVRNFQFTMGEPGRARLDVYDVTGRLVASLLNREIATGGHSVAWTGAAETGTRLGKGVYFARLETHNGTRTIKVLQLSP